MREVVNSVGYIRVSTDDQAEHGVSLEAQRAKILAFAAAHGLPAPRVVEDAGQSASSLDRPGLREVLALLEGGGADALIVAKLDRLTRSLRDCCHLVESHFARPSGPRLCSASEPVETRTASGRMVLYIQMTVAQWERETIVERTGTAMDHKRSKGERLGTVPYGWRLGDDGATLVRCPVEASNVATMRSLRGSKMTFRKIAETLDSAGIRTRSGRPWAVSTVAKILGEPAGSGKGADPCTATG